MTDSKMTENEQSGSEDAGASRREKLRALREKRREQPPAVGEGRGGRLGQGQGAGDITERFPRLAQLIESRRGEGGGQGGAQIRGGAGRRLGSGGLGVKEGGGLGRGKGGGVRLAGLRERLAERRQGGGGDRALPQKPGPGATPEEIAKYRQDLEKRAQLLEAALKRTRNELSSVIVDSPDSESENKD